MPAAKPQDDRPVSQLRNLGPACEADLQAAGITTAGQLVQAGVEGAFLRLLEARAKLGQSTHGCNAAYLYALYGAIHDVDFREVPESEKRRFKDFTAELRASGAFERPT